ncbi:TrkA family potassium uptake protein [Nodosilinea sp. P-1105]|uniref:potassium channel family protein n=1 Tax=Nodosilinea sp. P-1105 TaxID=2546229 RepID=UPI00146F41F9|nr:TrkA family potassium uptake protein [Nodosilinea sp. P-1105]NMF83378.1 TrkA family potassium uptake protein [Nodosilinea sp. P-1105]
MRVIVIGQEKLVYFLGKHFVAKGYTLTLITPNQAEAIALSHKLKATVLHGDGSDPAVLEDAGAYRADVLLALTAQDEDNLVTCQIAQKRFGIPRTIALVNDPDNQPVFRQLGVSVVFSATEILGHLIEQQTDYQDIKALVPVADGNVQLVELTLQGHHLAVGQTLQDLNLGEAIIACIVRQGNLLIPKGSSRLAAGDRLVVVSRAETYEAVYSVIVGETS